MDDDLTPPPQPAEGFAFTPRDPADPAALRLNAPTRILRPEMAPHEATLAAVAPEPPTTPMAAVGAPAAGAPAPREEGWLRENLEAVIVAVIMAFIIRHFCVEAFKIPTGSMEPTLIGNPVTGDKILVNKVSYAFADPKRWDIVVFRFPMDHTKNYIKRAVGLPGEHIQIAGGDIWVDGKIARKEGDVREQLWIPWYPELHRGLTPSQAWDFEDNPYWSTWGYQEQDHSADVLTCEPDARTDEPSWITLDAIDDRNPASGGDGPGHEEVGDIRWRANVQLTGGATLHVRIVEAASREYELALAPSGTSVVTLVTGDPDYPQYAERANTDITALVPAGAPWRSGVDVAFAQADDLVSLSIGGKRVWSAELADTPARLPEIDSSVSFGASSSGPGAKAVFKNLAVDRDVYYLDADEAMMGRRAITDLTVPADHYFCLGDNSRSSKDGRVWFDLTVTLKNGRSYTGDYDFEFGATDDEEAPRNLIPGVETYWQRRSDQLRMDRLEPGDVLPVDISSVRQSFDKIGFRDRYGRDLIWSPKDDVEKAEVRRAPFVSRDLIVGRAFVVVFPLSRQHFVD